MSIVTPIISATVIMCLQGQVGVNNKCLDGSQPFTAQVNILNSTSNCPSLTGNNKKCKAKLDSIIEIYKDKKRVFVLSPKGEVFGQKGFDANEAATLFWRALSESMTKELEFVK